MKLFFSRKAFEFDFDSRRGGGGGGGEQERERERGDFEKGEEWGRILRRVGVTGEPGAGGEKRSEIRVKGYFMIGRMVLVHAFVFVPRDGIKNQIGEEALLALLRLPSRWREASISSWTFGTLK